MLVPKTMLLLREYNVKAGVNGLNLLPHELFVQKCILLQLFLRSLATNEVLFKRNAARERGN